jgi:hypothetical protein
MVHRLVELIEIFVAEEVIIDNIPLATGVVEGVAVTLTGEVEPLFSHKAM